MVITEVKDKKDIKKFLDVARYIYKNDPVWVSPLDKDIEKVFDPQQNNFHKHGSISRWIALDDNGVAIGRIAAFVNDKKARTFPQPTGGIGFFECINDESIAFKLFDTAQNWLKNKGMEAMDGPINFGENDTFWGLLIEGFTHPSYGMNYNPQYYKQIFESYGFTPVYEQITNHLEVNKPFPDRFTKIAEWVSKKPGYTFRHLESKNIDQYASDLMEVYNDAWSDFPNFVPMNKTTIMESFKKMKSIMDEKLVWFAYVEDEPAAFIVMLPDANQFIKPLKGKLGVIEKLKFVYYKWKGATRIRAVVMGTKKSFQKHGLESALFIKIKEYVLPLNQYHECELSWVGDFNDKMLAIHEATGAQFGKKHVTMRKVF
ncbi:MAG: GNAT family N-acetyltransferase [Sphingobacteriaceae bacterium]|nr:GNAT family N-acetyltransferase [Sphingobacteriaceae bacterium]